jgi:hypothetical protein
VIKFLEDNFMAIWFSLMFGGFGLFYGHEISEMKLEKTYRAIYAQRIADQNKIENCIKLITRAK